MKNSREHYYDLTTQALELGLDSIAEKLVLYRKEIIDSMHV